MQLIDGGHQVSHGIDVLGTLAVARALRVALCHAGFLLRVAEADADRPETLAVVHRGPEENLDERDGELLVVVAEVEDDVEGEPQLGLVDIVETGGLTGEVAERLKAPPPGHLSGRWMLNEHGLLVAHAGGKDLPEHSLAARQPEYRHGARTECAHSEGHCFR